MSASVSIDVREWDAFFDSIGVKIKNGANLLKVAFNTAGFKDVIDHFDKEEGPSGRWKPRAESTQTRYSLIASGRIAPPKGFKRGSFSPSNKLLQLTGNLRKSFLPGNIRKLDSQTIVFFNNALYSSGHDEGTKTIPQREFMWLSDRAQDRMAEIVLSLLSEA